MYQLTREFRRHSNYFYYAVRSILRLDVLPAWAVGRAARVCCLLTLTLLFVSYVAVTSIASASGYRVRDLEKEVSTLKRDIQKTEVRVAEYNSMSNLEEKIKNSGLVAVDNVDYVDLTAPAVAKR